MADKKKQASRSSRRRAPAGSRASRLAKRQSGEKEQPVPVKSIKAVAASASAIGTAALDAKASEVKAPEAKVPETKAVVREERKERPKTVTREERPKVESKPVRRESRGPSTLETRFRNNRIGRFVLEAYYELRHKVTWPTFEEARNMTFVVIGLSGAVGLVLWLADTGLQQLFLLIGK